MVAITNCSRAEDSECLLTWQLFLCRFINPINVRHCVKISLSEQSAEKVDFSKICVKPTKLLSETFKYVEGITLTTELAISKMLHVLMDMLPAHRIKNEFFFLFSISMWAYRHIII